MLPFLQEFGLKLKQASQKNKSMDRVEDVANFQTSAATCCENKDVDSAFVTKYEITLDECLA